MISHAQVLASQTFFAGLSTETLDAIGTICSDVRFEPDELILSEGDSASEFYVLTSGRIALEINTASQSGLTIETLGPGDVVGISWILPGQHWTFDARAVEPCSALAVDAARLRRMCDDDPELGYALYRRVAGLIRGRLQATRVQLLDLYGQKR